VLGAPLAPFKLFDGHVQFRSSDLAQYPLKPDVVPILKADTITRPVTPEAVIRMWDEAGVEMGCGVQFNDLYAGDNRYLLDVARQYPSRIAPVIGLEPADPQTPATLRSLAKTHGLRSVRFAGRADGDGHFAILSDAARGAWEAADDLGLVVVLLPVITPAPGVLPGGMKRIAALADKYPKVRIVIDHMGFPVAENTPTFGFSPEHLALAAHKNVYFKHTTLLITQLALGGVPVSDVLQYAVATYGADHVLWGSAVGNNMVRIIERAPQGSNFPKIDQYGERVQLALDSARGLTLAQKRAVFHDTAKGLFAPDGRAARL
jgi:predicted TIM-barrel fold metal-dependent hydrolase